MSGDGGGGGHLQFPNMINGRIIYFQKYLTVDFS